MFYDFDSWTIIICLNKRLSDCHLIVKHFEQRRIQSILRIRSDNCLEVKRLLYIMKLSDLFTTHKSKWFINHHLPLLLEFCICGYWKNFHNEFFRFLRLYVLQSLWMEPTFILFTTKQRWCFNYYHYAFCADEMKELFILRNLCCF